MEKETLNLTEFVNNIKEHDPHSKRNYDYEALCRGDFAGVI